MAVEDDDPFAPAKKPAAHVIGENLDSISVEELAERIALLKAEIARLETAAAAKTDSLKAAESFFKS